MKKVLTNSGAKARQRNDTEDRAKGYSDFHRTLDRSLFATDVDFIEWRFRKGRLIPVGVFEVTRVDMEKEVDEQYFNSILNRYEHRDFQAKAVRHVADALSTNAYIVLYREDCSSFWIYNLSAKTGFRKELSPEQYEEFLLKL